MSTTSGPAPRFEGRAFTLGGTTYVVPPLALGAVKRLEPQIRGLTHDAAGDPTLSDLDSAFEIVRAAFVRNYPDITLEQLYELIDLGNFKLILKAVLGQSGVVPTEGNAVPGAGS